MTMIRRLGSIFGNRDGTAGIEFAIIAPVVVFLFLGGVTLFDIFRSYQKIIEANSVVADLVSRQTSIDKTYFETMYGVFTNLQADPTATRALRVSSVVRNGNDYTLAWSKVAGNETLLPTQKLDMETLPNIASGDSLIYVEGSTEFPVMFSILGFGNIVYHQTAFTRPRFIGAVAYTGS
jgi:Flp pilus assembly protein TadG